MLFAPPERVVALAGADLVAEQPVEAGGAEAVLAAGALEALVAETRPVDVVASGPIQAVALMGALRAVRSHGTFLLAPGQEQEVTSSCCHGYQKTR